MAMKLILFYDTNVIRVVMSDSSLVKSQVNEVGENNSHQPCRERAGPGDVSQLRTTLKGPQLRDRAPGDTFFPGPPMSRTAKDYHMCLGCNFRHKSKRQFRMNFA